MNRAQLRLLVAELQQRFPQVAIHPQVVAPDEGSHHQVNISFSVVHALYFDPQDTTPIETVRHTAEDQIRAVLELASSRARAGVQELPRRRTLESPIRLSDAQILQFNRMDQIWRQSLTGMPSAAPAEPEPATLWERLESDEATRCGG